jgi:hypothetical protein
MRAKPLLIGVLVALAGFVIGAGATVFALDSSRRMGGGVNVHGWISNPNVGGENADPWTRAVVARAGLLALAKSETAYYTMENDADGAPLRSDCVYTLTGRDPAARWWSITLYASDNYLVFNDDDAASVDATRVTRNENGAYDIRIAPTREAAANWLSSRNAAQFLLTVRLYNPDPSIQADLQRADLPKLARLSCQGGA